LTLKKFTFLILTIPLIIIVIYLSRVILMPFILAFFLAYALNPLVQFLQQKGARRDWAILTIYLAIFIIGALILELLIPRLIRDLTTLIQKLPTLLSDFQTYQTKLDKILEGWNLPLNPHSLTSELVQRSTGVFKNSIVQLGQSILKVFSKSLFYILTPLIAYYISRDYPILKRNLLQWVHKHLGNHWTRTFLKIDAAFKYYIRSQLLDILIVGTLFAIGLSLLGFEAAILLGFIAGVFNIIPYFGPVLGALPLVIFALLKSPLLTLYVIILFLVINQLEVIFLAPRIISNNLNIHPVTVIYLIMLGGTIFGLAGMVFAVPLGAIIGIIIKSIYEICFEEANNEPISEKLDLSSRS
jgi:predicted PurR-regulated permease PerM